MSAVDASALNKLARKFAAASNKAPKQLEIVVNEGRAFAARELKTAIGGKYNLTLARIRTIQVTAKGKYAMEISGPERPIMVNRGYRARQNKAGLSYAIEKGRTVVLSTGFIAKKKKLAFKRLVKSRLPIAPVTGPAVGTILRNDQFTNAPVKAIVEALTLNVTTRIKGMIDE